MSDKLENNNQSPNYWRSFEDLYNSREFEEQSHHEFREEVKEEFDPQKLSGFSRRKFFALIGASAALAGAGCGYRDKGEIIPYNTKPEEVSLGEAGYYATTCMQCENACGVLVKTREGRPIKVDGNPDHPVSKGKVCSKGQASIIALYDPERLQSPLQKMGMEYNKVAWKVADDSIIAGLKGIAGKEIAIISNRLVSPTGKRVINDFISAYPTAKVYSYELFNDNVRNTAWKKSTGSDVFPLVKWNEAKVIVALESDFLGSEGNKVENARLFAEGRDIHNTEKFSRLYCVEGNMTATGLNADYRLRIRPDKQFEFVNCLLTELSKKGISVSPAKSISAQKFAGDNKVDVKLINSIVADLLKNKGASIVYAGNNLPEEVHVAVNTLNEVLGNSSLYRNDAVNLSELPVVTPEEIKQLVKNMNSGLVGAVIHVDTNPVFTLPLDSGYKDALSKVGLKVSLCELENETSVMCDFVLPINQNFECWGDAHSRTGVYSLQQPVITPIYQTRQKEAILLLWSGGDASKYSDIYYYDYLRKNWEETVYLLAGKGKSFQQFWNESLHDGVVLTDEKAVINTTVNVGVLGQYQSVSTSNAGYSLILRESYSLGDGRFANNGWLQELPHPVTKITWDNYASVSFNTSRELNVENNDLIEVEAGGRKLELPVFIQPGAADNTVSIELGYGREKTGIVGSKVGFNANKLLTINSGLPFVFSNVTVKKGNGTYPLESTQEHHVFDKGIMKDIPQERGIIREGTVEEYKKNPHFLHEGKEHELISIYGNKLEELFTGVKWGMAVDMNKCIGCGECVISCIAENNIPVVGKEQVAKSREMQWIRVDRYYSGSFEEPKVNTQIMLCQHCDHAPCENVCPVVATTHSNDGLNQMVYNRCVGTRYCSNNCPYKVRRYNFYNFRNSFKEGVQETSVFSLVFNPEVTVRSRGVMEKCTFCIQRIMKAREDAIRDGKELDGSDVKTACQEACLTGAIKFGDTNNKDSEITKYRNHELGYHVLEELNVRPNVTYIAKLRNTHSEEI